MAFDNEVQTELAMIQKNNRGNYIRVARIDNKVSGSVNADIRMYYTDDNEELRPTQKGVRINSELLPDVLNALVKVLEVNEMMDLVDTLNELIENDGKDLSDTEESKGTEEEPEA